MGDPILLESAAFKPSFDTTAFTFQHNLAGNNLFSAAKLHELARRVAENCDRKYPGFFYLHKKNIAWTSPDIYSHLDEAFGDMAASGVRLKLTAIDTYPEYSEMFTGCVSEITRLAKDAGVDFRKNYHPYGATIFIASPNEVTPYHMDEEVNFLFQIAGNKTSRIYPLSVVSSLELEDYYHGGRLTYKEENPYEAVSLTPGTGVYQPPFHPHLVSVGDFHSISLSLGFTKLNFPTANVSRFNGYGRKLGVNVSPKFDSLKNIAVYQALKLKRNIKM